ncbi:sensor histidine kinase [Mucilaginibacter rivuli]|uniref:sensor histidine kinase n=1 Tax=Mucilaginibacter rivuli TaxID=2857527 RepID=UPI0021072048|nr:ATP-binding protein [Mucilaginibacter rivuli]
MVIYLWFHSFIRNDFFTHLNDRANVAAQLYLKADEITADSLGKVRQHYLKSLPGELVRLYDSRNSSAFIPDNKQHWDLQTIETVRKKKYVEFTDGGRQVLGIYYKDNQGNFVILVSATDIEGQHRLDKMLQTMIVVFFIVGGLLYFVSRLLATQALSPINEVVKQMQLIKATNLNLRVNEGNGKDEISELARNFNRLLAHLENAFELQKTYVANASHELRTPITTIIGEVEFALNKQHTPAENEKTLQLVLEETERLRDTISGLMELAQVDMDYTAAELNPVRMDELLWEVNEFWTNRYGAGLLKINILNLPEHEGLLNISANRQLMFIALNNLVGNAFKFSGRQTVTCDFYADERLIRLKITDSGIGIPSDDIDKVVRSFYRSDNARKFAGTGIGLFITQKIVQLFNGRLTIHSTEGMGTAITIQFLHAV